MRRVKKLSKKQMEEIRMRKALSYIANMGEGMKEEIKDWANIGKNAVFHAKEALAEKCPRCGKVK